MKFIFILPLFFLVLIELSSAWPCSLGGWFGCESECRSKGKEWNLTCEGTFAQDCSCYDKKEDENDTCKNEYEECKKELFPKLSGYCIREFNDCIMKWCKYPFTAICREAVIGLEPAWYMKKKILP